MRRLRITVVDLTTERPTRALYARLMNANFASVMPQVIAAWCEQAGHHVNYVCYTGFEDLSREVDGASDFVFIGSFTQAAHTAYAISNLHRKRGAITVLGGPHAVATRRTPCGTSTTSWASPTGPSSRMCCTTARPIAPSASTSRRRISHSRSRACRTAGSSWPPLPRIARRFRANRTAIPKCMNVVRGLSSERFDRARHHARIRGLLDSDATVGRFFDAETTTVPSFYANRVRRDLGVLWDALPEGGMVHDHLAYLRSEARPVAMGARRRAPSTSTQEAASYPN